MQRVHTLFVLLCLISFFCDRKSIYEYLKTKKNEATQIIGTWPIRIVQHGSMAQEAEADDTGYIVKVGQVAPDFTVTLTDGRTVTLSDFRGKVVMLQFTASWCGVCRKEMPFIEKDIWQKHKSDPDSMLMGIDRDEPLNKVIAFGKSTGVTYPLGLDPGADIFAKYALRQAGITRNVLIDKEGRIVMLTRLYNPEEFSALVKKIDELLK